MEVIIQKPIFGLTKKNNTMNLGAIIGIISGLLVSISMWMPVYARFGVSVSFMDVPELKIFSWVIVIIGVLLAAMSLINKMATNIIGIIFAGIGFLLSLLLLSIALEDAGDGVDYGLYVMVLACIGSVVGNIIALVLRKKEKANPEVIEETVD